jgi:hypothetical protein
MSPRSDSIGSSSAAAYTATRARATMAAGTRRRARRPQNDTRSIPFHFWSSSSRRLVIRKPDSTKNEVSGR